MCLSHLENEPPTAVKRFDMAGRDLQQVGVAQAGVGGEEKCFCYVLFLDRQ